MIFVAAGTQDGRDLTKLLHDAGAEYLDCYTAGIPAAV